MNYNKKYKNFKAFFLAKNQALGPKGTLPAHYRVDLTTETIRENPGYRARKTCDSLHPSSRSSIQKSTEDKGR